KRCSRCILPDGFLGLPLDEEGVCGLCRAEPQGQRASGQGLEQLGERIRSLGRGSLGRGGRYDCVVPLSGGKDSTYILYSAVRDLALRVIAVNYDSGYQSDEGRGNVENACRALGVPLVVRRPDPDLQRSMLREILEISRELGCYTRTCTNCELMLRNVALGTAREHDVPVILWGSASAESAEPQEYRDYRHGRSPLAILSSKLESFRRLKLGPGRVAKLLPHIVRYTALNIRHRVAMGVPASCVLNPYRLMPFPPSNPTVVHYFDYASWDPTEKVEILKRELGWRHPPDRQSRFDCLLYSFVEHRHLKLHGITDSGAVDCGSVREGRLTRQRALEQERTRIGRIERECDALVESLGLDRLEIELPQ
ncbi:MAG: hypothetical protein JXB46_09410, partial [Candidatus Eisenbacteria bacterium]|nr:hypothetical protein [Candidatus Eisenbacteria bacterium]